MPACLADIARIASWTCNLINHSAFKGFYFPLVFSTILKLTSPCVTYTQLYMASYIFLRIVQIFPGRITEILSLATMFLPYKLFKIQHLFSSIFAKMIIFTVHAYFAYSKCLVSCMQHICTVFLFYFLNPLD